MNRFALLAAVALAALTVALPALANDGRSVKGVVAALTATSVSVKDAHRTVTCALTANSPSLASFAEGDRVQAQCRRAERHLVLTKIRHLTAAPNSGANGTEPVKFGGTVTALSAESISLHDGDHDLTCSLGDASPSTTGLSVGDHAKVVCQNGALVSVERLGSEPEPPRPPLTTAGGTVTAVSADSLTLHNAEHGDLTCTVSSASPSVAEVHVGDLVKVACKDGVLSALARLTAAPPPPPLPAPQPLTTFAGTLTALSSTSLTVHNDEHGDLSCRVTDGSPRLGDYHVGDRVKLACADGVLKLIAKF